MEEKLIVEYDLKLELTKKYEKRKISRNYPKNATKEEQQKWFEDKAFNKYVDVLESSKNKIIDFIGEKEFNDIFANSEEEFDENDKSYKYLKRYILYRYNGKYDCDNSYLVYDFYKNRLNYEVRINEKYYRPEFFDTYFSVQTLYGKTINNYIKPNNSNNYYGNDFEWQYKNFDIIKKEVPEKLLKAFNKLAYYYHTIGNIAPCPEKMNTPKGMTSDCFDRLDLFLDVVENWLKWYYENEICVAKKYSHNVERLHLQEFVNPSFALKKVKIPIHNNDEEINNFAKHIDDIVKIIKNRGKKLV